VIAETPEPPYYAVVFTSVRTDGDNDYAETARRLMELAAEQHGYLGIESARNRHDASGITVSYWTDLKSIRQWKHNAEHLMAQQRGKSEWYSAFRTRIAKVEKVY